MLISVVPRLVKNSGCVRPVNALYKLEVTQPNASAPATALAMAESLACLPQCPHEYKTTGNTMGTKKPKMAAGSVSSKRYGERVCTKYHQSKPKITSR